MMNVYKINTFAIQIRRLVTAATENTKAACAVVLFVAVNLSARLSLPGNGSGAGWVEHDAVAFLQVPAEHLAVFSGTDSQLD
jgi:hypothetical protein